MILQFAALPVAVSLVQAKPSLQLIAAHEAAESQVSGGVVTPSPQADGQSVSLPRLHPGGQQPSPFAHAVIAGKLHDALHCIALPVKMLLVQAFMSSQLVTQRFAALELIGSQVSGGVTTPSPHEAEQLLSVAIVQPPGQQPSPFWHCVMGGYVHAAVQFAALPVSRS
jgi:hypothetical protein